MSSDDEAEPWHLDKKVPIALIATIFIQTCGAVWWAAGLSARVDAAEKSIAKQGDHGDRIVRVESMLGAVRDDLQEIKVDLKSYIRGTR